MRRAEYNGDRTSRFELTLMQFDAGDLILDTGYRIEVRNSLSPT